MKETTPSRERVALADLFQRAEAFVRGLHRCERGDIPIGQIVLIALVVVPLLLVLFFFRDEATNLINTWWAKIRSNTPANPS